MSFHGQDRIEKLMVYIGIVIVLLAVCIAVVVVVLL